MAITPVALPYTTLELFRWELPIVSVVIVSGGLRQLTPAIPHYVKVLSRTQIIRPI